MRRVGLLLPVGAPKRRRALPYRGGGKLAPAGFCGRLRAGCPWEVDPIRARGSKCIYQPVVGVSPGRAATDVGDKWFRSAIATGIARRKTDAIPDSAGIGFHFRAFLRILSLPGAWSGVMGLLPARQQFEPGSQAHDRRRLAAQHSQ